LLDLFAGNLRNLCLVRHARTALDAASLLNQNSSGGSLGDKSEGTVSIDRNHNGDNQTHVVLGALVEFLRERHDVDAVLAECRSNGGRRGCFASRYLQLNEARNLLSHFIAPPKFVVDGGTRSLNAFLPQGLCPS